uniref:Uncharacterized protein n=1 Tax=Phaseolus vulgaris TaxID=3885 RepID=V7CUN6_PHAVU|nr:hypothetical protein PHAVU_001G105900g [Phaseolus vulgaris]ESW33877.1 hypothetical protein PHAVU_001G105900g [Phaseolus vulgaris]
MIGKSFEALSGVEQLQSLKSKVNFDRLGELFNELEKTDDPKKEKKARLDPPLDNHDNLQSFEDKNDDEMGSVDEFEDDMGEMYQNGLSTDNNIADAYYPEDDGYGYNDDDYY